MINFYNFIYNENLISINRTQISSVHPQFNPDDDSVIFVCYASSDEVGSPMHDIYKFKDYMMAEQFHKELVCFDASNGLGNGRTITTPIYTSN